MAKSSKSKVDELLRKLPPTIRFGAHEHIILKTTFPEHKLKWAELDTHAHVLSLEINSPNSKKLAETLTHEVMHGIWNDRYLWADERKDEEHIIQQLAAGWIALLLDNPWLLPWLAGALRK